MPKPKKQGRKPSKRETESDPGLVDKDAMESCLWFGSSEMAGLTLNKFLRSVTNCH